MNSNWGACYFDHFDSLLGEMSGREIFAMDAENPTIQILNYDRAIAECRTFTSLGLTHYAPDIGGTAEICCVTDAGWEMVPSLLANILFYMVQQKIKIGWGTAISGINAVNPSFAQMFDKTALYITNPFGFPEQFRQVECSGLTGQVYLSFFISRNEHALFMDRGAEALEELLASKDVDPFDLRRKSAV